MSSRKVNKGKPQEPEGEYRFPPPDESPARPASEEATNDGTIDSSSEDEANSLARELKDTGTKKQGKLVGAAWSGVVATEALEINREKDRAVARITVQRSSSRTRRDAAGNRNTPSKSGSNDSSGPPAPSKQGRTSSSSAPASEKSASAAQGAARKAGGKSAPRDKPASGAKKAGGGAPQVRLRSGGGRAVLHSEDIQTFQSPNTGPKAKSSSKTSPGGGGFYPKASTGAEPRRTRPRPAPNGALGG